MWTYQVKRSNHNSKNVTASMLVHSFLMPVAVPSTNSSSQDNNQAKQVSSQLHASLPGIER